MAFLKALRQCVQYSSADLFSIKRQAAALAKPRVSSNVWTTIKELDIALFRPRGCRGGAKIQRPIPSLITGRSSVPSIATGFSDLHDNKINSDHNILSRQQVLIPIKTVKDSALKQEEISVGYPNAWSVKNKAY